MATPNHTTPTDRRRALIARCPDSVAHAAILPTPKCNALFVLFIGGIVSVSGVTKEAWSQFLWEQAGGYSVAQNFLDISDIPVFDLELLVALGICACLLLVWWSPPQSEGVRTVGVLGRRVRPGGRTSR